MADFEFENFLNPLNPMRFQANLGSERERRYKEGDKVVKLSLARVTKVNYKYNTVEVTTTVYKNSTGGNPNDNGKFSARLPVAFGGTTPDGNVYGSNTLVTVGSLVLVGYLEGSKDQPIVLNIYGDTDNQSQLTRTTFSSADESQEAIQQELWQLFTLYPSMTYRNIDGHGNQEVTFSGKSFLYITDSDPDNSYVQDGGFDYDDLPSSRYANGELIEPKSAASPTVLYVHQGIYESHRVTFFIKADGTVRMGSRHKEGTGITFMEMTTDGTFHIVQNKGTTDPEGEPEKFSKIGINDDGDVIMKSREHELAVNSKGVYIDGKPISSWGGGGEPGENPLDDIINDLTKIKTEITVVNGKIDMKVSREELNVDLEEVERKSKELYDGAKKEIDDLNEVILNLDEYIDGAFQDGIIDQAEAKVIESYINSLRTEKVDLDVKYEEMISNEYLPTEQHDFLEVAKGAYDSKFAELIDIINAAIQDGKITDEDRQAVNGAFQDYRTAISNLSAAFQKAADAIALAMAKSAEDAARKYTEAQFTILADEIKSRVKSEEFTKVVGDVNSKIADVEKKATEEIQNTNDRVTEVEKKVPYKAEIFSTNGLVFRDGLINTTLFCKVFRGDQEITDSIAASRFKWTRVSDDSAGDAAWNSANAAGKKSVVITAADVKARATFNCEIQDE